MRKQLYLLTAAAVLFGGAEAKADVYKDCLDKNYMSDQAMATCTLQEAERVMRTIKQKYNALAANPYFKQWNANNSEFGNLINNWTQYRDRYCDLYGYTYTQGLGTISALQSAGCVLNMNKQFLQDVEEITKIYQESK